jgi:lysine 2,3-aminomutase
MLSPRRLASIVEALSGNPHIEILRIHTRVPVAEPAQFTDALTEALDTPKSMWVVLHASHAREFPPEAEAAIRHIQACAVPVLGQSVLLRGVNDSAEALETCSVPCSQRAGSLLTTCTSSTPLQAPRGSTCR